MTSNWAWRIPCLLQVVLSLFQVCIIWFVPDSPRWLVYNGKYSEALGVLVKYHGEGDEDSEFVQAEYAQIKQTLKLGPNITNRRTVLDARNAKADDHHSIPWFEPELDWTHFASPTASIVVCIALTAFIFNRNFLSPILDSIGIRDHRVKNVVNLAYVFVKFVNSSAIALIMTRFRRRTMYLVSNVCDSIS